MMEREGGTPLSLAVTVAVAIAVAVAVWEFYKLEGKGTRK